MKKALLISNNSWSYDYRLHQIEQILTADYCVDFLIQDRNSFSKHSNVLVAAFTFLKSKENYKIIFFAGSLMKSFLAYFFLKKAFYIYYVREILDFNNNKSLKLALYALGERYLIRKSNLVVTGNSLRALYLLETYNLNTIPTVWENIRKLNADLLSIDLISKYNKKYSYLDGSKVILFTSGYSIWRETDRLILSKKYISNDFSYLVVGGGMMSDNPRKDYKIIQEIIKEHSLQQIYFQDKVEEPELLYLIRRSYIGVVHYNKKNINNLYCSSGKVHEFLSEGIPIVTTTNLPLVSLTEGNDVGISTEFINIGIAHIDSNYEMFKERILYYLKNNNHSLNNSYFQSMIQDKIADSYNI